MFIYLSSTIYRPYIGQCLTFYVTPKIFIMLEEPCSHVNHMQTFRFFCILPNTLFSFLKILSLSMLFLPFPSLLHSSFSSLFPFSPLPLPISLLLLLTIFVLVDTLYILLEFPQKLTILNTYSSVDSRRINSNKKSTITKSLITI